MYIVILEMKPSLSPVTLTIQSRYKFKKKKESYKSRILAFLTPFKIFLFLYRIIYKN